MAKALWNFAKMVKFHSNRSHCWGDIEGIVHTFLERFIETKKNDKSNFQKIFRRAPVKIFGLIFPLFFFFFFHHFLSNFRF